MLLTQKMQSLKRSVFSKKSPIDKFFPEKDIEPFEPDQVFGYYATWRDDPRNSIIIHYQSTEQGLTLEYKQENYNQWTEQLATSSKDYIGADMYINWFELSNLEADTVYDFRIKGTNHNLKFKTMAQDLNEMKVALTSDMSHAYVYMEYYLGLGTLKDYDPDVLVITGDIAHADGKTEEWQGFWQAWFERGNFNARGHIIPIVAQLGNHDGYNTNSSYTQLYASFGATADQCRDFHNFFPLGDLGYHTVDVGNYFSIIGLDTGHTNSIPGTQTAWLEQKLQERQDGRWIVPCAHIAPYPTRYDYNNQYCQEIREHWTPLFTQYQIPVVHSGHNHLFAVTHPVTNEQLDLNGAIYIGQGYSFGTWGGELNADPNVWYLDKVKGRLYDSENARSFTGITLTPNKMLVEGISIDNGTVIYSKEFTK